MSRHDDGPVERYSAVWLAPWGCGNRRLMQKATYADLARIQRSEAGIGALKSAVSLAWDSEGFYFQTHVSTVPRCLHDSLRHDFDWPFALHQPFFGCGSEFICRPMGLGRPLSNGYPSTIQFDRRSRPPSQFTFFIPLNLMIRRNCFISSLLLSLQEPCQ